MAVVIYSIFALLHFFLLWQTIKLYRQTPMKSLRRLIPVIFIFGLENSIHALSPVLNEFNLLFPVSKFRYLLHFIITPLLIPFTIKLASEAGVYIASRLRVRALGWILYLSLLALGLKHFFSLNLYYEYYMVSLRFIPVDITPSLIIGVCVFAFTLTSGSFIYAQRTIFYELAGAIIMFIGGLVIRRMPMDKALLIFNGVELFLISGYLLTAQKIAKKQ